MHRTQPSDAESIGTVEAPLLGGASFDLEGALRELAQLRLPRVQLGGALEQERVQRRQVRALAARGGRPPSAWRPECSSCWPRCPPTSEDTRSCIRRYSPDICVQAVYVIVALALLCFWEPAVAAQYSDQPLRPGIVPSTTMPFVAREEEAGDFADIAQVLAAQTELLAGNLSRGGHDESELAASMLALAQAADILANDTDALAGNEGVFSDFEDAASEDVEVLDRSVRQATRSSLLRWWIFLGGALSGLFLATKNIANLAHWFSRSLTETEGRTNEEITDLYSGLSEDLEAVLRDAADSGHHPSLAIFLERNGSEDLYLALSGILDQVVRDLNFRNQLPLPMSERVFFVCCASVPIVLVLVFQLGWNCMLIYRHLLEASEESRRLISEQPATETASEEFSDVPSPLLVNFLINVGWSLVSSWGLKRFLFNSTVRWLEHDMNHSIIEAVMNKLPKGPDRIQALIDHLESFDDDNDGDNEGCRVS